MNNNEVNKIIAEYMGLKYDSHAGWVDKDGTYVFTESIDALVPVWERIKTQDASWGFQIELFVGLECEYGFAQWNRYGQITEQIINKSIYQVAVHATARAIKELK